jgi:hypothetical protein
MTKQEIIDYVVNTPSNSNGAVLSSMLDSFSEGEGGSGSSRILLYENDTASFQSAGDWLYATVPTHYLNAIFKALDGDYTLTVDDESYTSGLTADGNNYYMGVANPGDSEHVGVNKIGVAFNAEKYNDIPYVESVSMIMISSADFTTETHSVKIYKEV